MAKWLLLEPKAVQPRVRFLRIHSPDFIRRETVKKYKRVGWSEVQVQQLCWKLYLLESF